MTVDLIRRLNEKTAVIGIFGLGYVGLPLAVEFAHFGLVAVIPKTV